VVEKLNWNKMEVEMENQHVIDTCSQCGGKAFVVIYPTVEGNIFRGEDGANLFLWECPKCGAENIMPIAKKANAVNRD